MFPIRYYGTHYFTGHYFPKAGATPPDIIRVLINGVNKIDNLWYGGTSQWNIMRGGRGTCTLSFVLEPGDLFSPQVGQSIQIFDPRTERVWFGVIDKLGRRWIGDDGWRVIIVTGITMESLFDTAELDKVKYAGVSFADAFTDIVTRVNAAGIGLGTISTGPTIESLEVSNAAQGFSGLCLLAGFIWYIDPLDGNVYAHAPGLRAADWEMASEDVLWDTIDWTQNRSDFRDNQVLQLPGRSLAPVEETFDGDGVETVFDLATVPEYIISVDLNIGVFGFGIAWEAGTVHITVTPPPPDGSTVIVRYADSGVVTASQDGPGVGSKTARYTKTRTFTPEGGQQEVTAIAARYAMLPAQLSLSTDKPGIRIGRNLTINLERPLEADVLNGHWQVQELAGAIVPGLDQRDEPYGHFRYTVKLINFAATAVFQGDGATTVFELPVVPDEVTGFRTDAEGRTGEWLEPTQFFEILPALDDGQSASVDYIDNANAPDVPTFVDTWEDMADKGSDTPVVVGGDPQASATARPDAFTRTATLYDLAVGDDIAPHTPVYADGMAYRMLGVLRKAIASDLTIRLNKGPLGNVVELVTVTIPSSAQIDEVIEWSLASGSPPVLGPFFDKEVLTIDILDSDGSTDVNGVAQFTVEWLKL